MCNKGFSGYLSIIVRSKIFVIIEKLQKLYKHFQI